MAPLLKALSKKLIISEAIRSELQGSAEEKRQTLESIMQDNHVATIAPKEGESVMEVITMLPKNASYIIGEGYWVDKDIVYDEAAVFIYMDKDDMRYDRFKKLMMDITIANDQVAYVAKQADANNEDGSQNQADLIFTGIAPDEKTQMNKWQTEKIGTLHIGEKNPMGYTILNNVLFSFKN